MRTSLTDYIVECPRCHGVMVPIEKSNGEWIVKCLDTNKQVCYYEMPVRAGKIVGLDITRYKARLRGWI